MRLTPLATGLALLASLTTTGCLPPTACTLVGYENGLHVDIQVPATPATYRVEVEADGDLLSLRYEVTTQGIRCLECFLTGENLAVSDSFSTNPQSLAVNVRHVDNEGGPRTATVRVFRSDALAAEASFEPRYETDEPNGRGCGEHVFASASLVVP